MNIARTTEEIKKYALCQAGMDKVGIAGVDRFNESPEGFHPEDILPGCKSVIVFCIRVPDGAVQSIFRAYEKGMRHLHGIYGTYGYTIAPNYHLMFGSYKISQFVEKITGCIATPNAAGPMQGSKQISMRHAAVAAGLGEFGWSSIVLTPEFGPRNRFGAVLTTAELEPDPLYNGPKLCDPTKCRVCEKMCLGRAIPAYDKNQSRKITIGDKNIEYSQINWNKCRVYCHGMRKSVASDYDFVPVSMDNPTDFDLMEPLKKLVVLGASHDSPQVSPTWKCGNCLAYCPVGNWKERFYDTGLTNINIEKFIEK